jgi:pimeloyl-ACP methyl ester carboxylesterase
MPMWIVYLVLGIPLAYAGLTSALYLAQTRLLFPVHLVGGERQDLPQGAERIEIRARDGERLVGVRLPSSGESGTHPLLLGFGGNAWNAETAALYLHGIFPECEVVTFHYRGYAPSGGRPSSQALLDDSLAAFDSLQRDHPRKIVAVGFSIGGSIAAHLVRHRPVTGAILVTSFDSLDALARDHFPWLPVTLLLRHHMPTIDFVRDAPVPIAMIAAGRDTIVPPSRTEPLRRHVGNLVFDQTIDDAGHNDLYDHPAFPRLMREALVQIEATARQR